MPELSNYLLFCFALKSAVPLVRTILRYALAFYVVHRTRPSSSISHLVPFLPLNDHQGITPPSSYNHDRVNRRRLP